MCKSTFTKVCTVLFSLSFCYVILFRHFFLLIVVVVAVSFLPTFFSFFFSIFRVSVRPLAFLFFVLVSHRILIQFNSKGRTHDTQTCSEVLSWMIFIVAIGITLLCKMYIDIYNVQQPFAFGRKVKPDFCKPTQENRIEYFTHNINLFHLFYPRSLQIYIYIYTLLLNKYIVSRCVCMCGYYLRYR